VRRFAVFVQLAALALGVGCQGGSEEPPRAQTTWDKQVEDEGKLQGTWKLVLLKVDGVVSPPEKAEKARVIIAGNRLTMRQFADEQDLVVRYRIDVGTNPRCLDLFTLEDGKLLTGGACVGKGIYQFESGGLTICFRMPPVDWRPKVFASEPRSNVALWVLRKDP
jgi:uncharacterized protein (TIGR03067 family)